MPPTPPVNTSDSPRLRVIPRKGGIAIEAVGRHQSRTHDLYAYLIDSSWLRITGIMIVLYLTLNLLFASAYVLDRGGIQNAREGSFLDAFFFSVQTLATIGYGSMAPHGIIANALVTLEAMIGFAYYGLVTGLMFAKFSRPSARVLFSHMAVIAPHNGTPHFMLRLANERDNRIVNVEAKLTLMREEPTHEGKIMRRFYDLPLLRKEIPVLRYSWTLFHPIDANSPLYGMDAAALRAAEVEIIVSLTGLDETFAQTVHARHSYIEDEIFFNAQFQDIIERGSDDRFKIRYDKFHEVVQDNSR